LRPRLTIREIAHEAGVSTATVSRVMNNPERVSAETRDSVRAVIERRRYVSHGIAMSLASARSFTIGLIIPTITNSIYASSTQAIQRVAHGAGYTVLLGVSEFLPELEEELIRSLLKRRVDGLILTGGERPGSLYDVIEANGVHYVVTWKLLGERVARPSVSFDNYRAGRVAMDHLIALGHRRIALICGRTPVNDRARERRRAYEDALQDLGEPLDPALIHEGDFELDAGRTAMRLLLKAAPPPTAVFCANDIQAIGALFECAEAGIVVPADISLIGFDDLPVAQYTRPQLTTIRVPARQMGELAATRLIQAIKTGTPPETEELPIELIVRGTTAPVSPAAPRIQSGRAARRASAPLPKMRRKG
jgi:LacI family transcriptional regulator